MSHRLAEARLSELSEVSRCLGGQIESIGSNSPVLLNTHDQGLLVLEGHVDVFAVELVAGIPTGQRHSLFRVDRGEMVFGLGQANQADPKYGLIAVGVNDTRVMTALPVTTLTQFDAEQGAAILDRTVTALLGIFDGESLMGESAKVEADTSVEVFPDRPVFGATRRPVWLFSHGADLAYLGPSERLNSVLPVNSASWITSAETTRLTTRSSRTLLELDDATAAVAGFFHQVSERLQVELPRREREAARVQQLVRTRSEEAMSASLRKMAGLANPGSPSGPELWPTVDTEFNRLHCSFLKVARALQMTSTETLKRINPDSQAKPLDRLASTYQVRTRTVMLKGTWWLQQSGPLLAYREDSLEPVALLPGEGGYLLWDPVTQQSGPVDDEVSGQLQGEAVMLYRPLAPHPGRLSDLIDHVRPVVRQDLRRITMLGLLSGLLALAVPLLTGELIEDVLPRADRDAMVAVITGLALIAVGSAIFEVIKAIAVIRVESTADLHLQSAMFDRLLRMPVAFFRRFGAGDLADRVLGVQTIRQTLSATLMQGLLAVTYAGFSLLVLLYLHWQLALVALLLAAVSAGVTLSLVFRQLDEERQRIAKQGQAESFIIQFLTGIGKLRIAAAESRAFSQWAHHFTEQKRHFVRASQFANQQEVFQSVFPVLATACIFLAVVWFYEQTALDMQLSALVQSPDSEAGKAQLTTGEFVAFITAFGQLLAAMTTGVKALSSSLSVVPVFERLKPLLESVPETHRGRAVQLLKGQIDIDQVTFRYSKGAPTVLNNLSLTIEPGEFVAIVGPSGSGKSTLVRLLLGFESLEQGEILFDRTPLSNIDITSLRSQIRVVQQHGHLITGSIYSNIVGSSTLTVDDAWRAAGLAGLKEDIEAMPMGMHTVINEGVNTLSGGQRQRLMIARALVHRPRILLLDEPTSALDNQTQKTVMSSLSQLSATRIMIAHRLSTIQVADRILVLSGGQLVEQGSYEELINCDGLFAEMAHRQLL